MRQFHVGSNIRKVAPTLEREAGYITNWPFKAMLAKALINFHECIILKSIHSSILRFLGGVNMHRLAGERTIFGGVVPTRIFLLCKVENHFVCVCIRVLTSLTAQASAIREVRKQRIIGDRWSQCNVCVCLV